jgi:hypothetical protein
MVSCAALGAFSQRSNAEWQLAASLVYSLASRRSTGSTLAINFLRSCAIAHLLVRLVQWYWMIQYSLNNQAELQKTLGYGVFVLPVVMAGWAYMEVCGKCACMISDYESSTMAHS